LAKNCTFSVHYIDATVQHKMNCFYVNVQRIHKTKDLDAISYVIVKYILKISWGWRDRSGTAGGRSSECFFWVLPKRCISKPDLHRKDSIQ